MDSGSAHTTANSDLDSIVILNLSTGLARIARHSVNVSDDIVYKKEANNNNKSTDVFKNDSNNKYIYKNKRG